MVAVPRCAFLGGVVDEVVRHLRPSSDDTQGTLHPGCMDCAWLDMNLIEISAQCCNFPPYLSLCDGLH